ARSGRTKGSPGNRTSGGGAGRQPVPSTSCNRARSPLHLSSSGCTAMRDAGELICLTTWPWPTSTVPMMYSGKPSKWCAASLRVPNRLLAERHEKVLAPHEERPVGDSWCGHDVVVQSVHRQQLERGTGLHDPDLTLLRSEVEASARSDGRGRVA